jgi:putative heme-binding domain-containing protein
MEKYKTLLNLHNVSKADPNKGRYFFDGLCAACHKMYDSGGILGPELTGANRTDIDYLLNNVMDPSGIIQDDYKMVMITTRDGRTYAGNIANQNKRSIVLRVVGQDAVVISKSDIQSIDNSELSMMPEGMLDDMSTSEVLDLFSYLMLTTSQVEPLEE